MTSATEIPTIIDPHNYWSRSARVIIVALGSIIVGISVVSLQSKYTYIHIFIRMHIAHVFLLPKRFLEFCYLLSSYTFLAGVQALEERARSELLCELLCVCVCVCVCIWVYVCRSREFHVCMCMHMVYMYVYTYVCRF